nr:hypothetical protein [Nonlabens ulvanivorans]
MGYIDELSFEDKMYLADHPDGFKHHSTDFRLLRERDEQQSLNDYLDDKAIMKANNEARAKE